MPNIATKPSSIKHTPNFLLSAYQILLLACVLSVLSNCAVERRFEAATLTPFLDVPGIDLKGKLNNLPFDHSWVADDFDSEKYSKVLILPVSTEFVKIDAWRDSLSVAIGSKETYELEVKNLANYATQELKGAFAVNDDNRFERVELTTSDTLILEVALSEVIFGKPLASAGALVAPVPGAGLATSVMTDPSVAFELRVRDATSRRVVATVADRSFPTARVVNFNKLTASSACREIVDAWTELVVQSLNQGKLKKVSKPSFELKPW